MRKIFFAFIFLMIVFIGYSYGQDTLPKLNVKNIKGQIFISWKNSHGARVTSIAVQRSYDSLRNFSTFNSVLNPSSAENGVSDSKPYNGRTFYRVFIVFEGGDYLFSKSYRPVADSGIIEAIPKKNIADVIIPNPDTTEIIPTVIKSPKPTRKDVLEIPVNHLAPLPQQYVAKSIYTGKDNNVIINLPQASAHKYYARFFDENYKQVFKINSIYDDFLIIDKVNFRHAGLFYYKLYEDGLLIENNSFFIPKDAKITNSEER